MKFVQRFVLSTAYLSFSHHPWCDKNHLVTNNFFPFSLHFDYSNFSYAFIRSLVWLKWCVVDVIEWKMWRHFLTMCNMQWKAGHRSPLHITGAYYHSTHQLSYIFSPIFQSFVFLPLPVCMNTTDESNRDMLSSMTDATIERKKRFWHELDWVSTFYYPIFCVCIICLWRFVCFAITVKFTVSNYNGF